MHEYYICGILIPYPFQLQNNIYELLNLHIANLHILYRNLLKKLHSMIVTASGSFTLPFVDMKMLIYEVQFNA